MILLPNDRSQFFKYYTAQAAKLTLMNTSRKWSTPLLFNDPFDNQFDLYLEEPTEQGAIENLNQYLQILTSPIPFKENQFGERTPDMELLRQAYQRSPDIEYSKEDIAYLLEGVKEGMRNATKIAPEASAEIRKIMADTSVFCVSETHDNLLMWSHYAQNHTGAVVEFLSLREVDSPLLLARPVRYLARMPRLSFASLMNYDALRREVYETITLSKGHVWCYEKEWRIIASLRDKRQSYEILPYALEEIGAVYLGCRMTNDDRKEIIGITKWKYPKAKIYEAKKDPQDFALVFNEFL